MEILAVSNDSILIIAATIAAAILLIISSCVGAIFWIIYQQRKEITSNERKIEGLCEDVKKIQDNLEKMEKNPAEVQDSHKNDKVLLREQDYLNKIERNTIAMNSLMVPLAKIEALIKASSEEAIEDIELSLRHSQKAVKKAK